MGLVRFVTTTDAGYSGITSKDKDTLYFISDERRIYKGDVPYSGGIFITVAEFPEIGEVNTLYVNSATGEVRYYNGTSYQTVVPATGKSITGKGDGSLATTAAVAAYVTSHIGDLNVSALKGRVDTLEGEMDTAQGQITTINGEGDGSIKKSASDAVASAKSYTDTVAAGKANTAHTHKMADVTGLSDALAGKANATHTHAIADVTGLQTALNGKADKADVSDAKADASAAKSAIDAHASDTGNPHKVTAEQLGLGDVKAKLAGKQDKLNRSSGVTVGRLAVQGSNESANTSEYLAQSGSAKGAMTIGGILPEPSRDGALSIAAFNHGANYFACEEGSDKATFSIAENAWIKNDPYILGILSKYSTTEDFAVSLLKEMFTGAAIVTNETQDFVGFVKSVDSVNRATLTLSVTMDRKLTGKSTPAQHQYLLRNRGNTNFTMYSQATSDYGFAIGGPNNVITGRCSGAIGTTSFITGQNSMAVGSYDIVSGNFSHAMLIGDLNYAVGHETRKDGSKVYSGRSYAFGNQNTIRRSFVTAVGFGLLVYEDGDAAVFNGSGIPVLTPVVVAGTYNNRDVKKNHPNAAFIVGNGTTSRSRSDGLVVNTDGTVEMESLVLVKQDGTKVKLTADVLEKIVPYAETENSAGGKTVTIAGV